MAVQKNRKTRSKIGMRRAHDHLPHITLFLNKKLNVVHLRHHIPDYKLYCKYKNIYKIN
ncbi:50S ribosomal protein L32 [Candidatus Johnevansia muelleri]|uniref:Large ribosomal subunit protein bL32 n=1 Tax=Candidatus Johnevansia muelleri TaxID=1495769 RepID=A0A078KEG7_9GAMM|nr:50S ribosomal protein L32 [Candidatus Evansia muelleri]